MIFNKWSLSQTSDKECMSIGYIQGLRMSTRVNLENRSLSKFIFSLFFSKLTWIPSLTVAHGGPAK